MESDVHIYKGIYFKECITCGHIFRTKKSHLSRRKTCSTVCSGFRKKTMYEGNRNPNYGNRGESNPIFKGGSLVTQYGYRMLLKHEHPNSDKRGYIFEHRYVMSQHLCRPLRKDEHIHHIDEDKLNNNISNLRIISLSEHSRLHAFQNPQPRSSNTGEFITRGTNK